MAELKKVLAIDDDADVLEFVKTVLSPYYQVKTGGSGEECLDSLAEDKPDLILLDVMMSYMSEGLDCVRAIKQNPAMQTIPVVMMTSVNDVYDYRTQIEESFFTYDRWLEKPVVADALLKTIREILGR
jgi:CheY-like chemotaxis protein